MNHNVKTFNVQKVYEIIFFTFCILNLNCEKNQEKDEMQIYRPRKARNEIITMMSSNRDHRTRLKSRQPQK